ncbi:MAG: type IV pilin protein [Thiotrichales bacterium]
MRMPIKSLKSRRATAGFSLIELMVALVIVGVLASVAVPSYQEQVRKGRRTDAKITLAETAHVLERCFATNLTYNDCPIGADGEGGIARTDLGETVSLPSREGWYVVSVEVPSAVTFTLTAAPSESGVMHSDTRCAEYTLDQTGAKGISGEGKTSDCW